MNDNKKLKTQTLQIIALLEPALRKRKGKYQTAWGTKTREGLKASIFNILATADQLYETSSTETSA